MKTLQSLFPQNLLSRAESIELLRTQKKFDLVIVGGGIHGSAFARFAQMNGFSVVLLEKGDYASGTSSRSSKMAHGGLRYLELLDFQQVFEGIRAREELFENAAHVVRPEEFLIPVKNHELFTRLKIGLGLTLYDLLLKNPARKHRWIPSRSLNYPELESLKGKLRGCYRYTDGLLSDTRLVLENILDARLHGAICLNHAKVEQIDGILQKKRVLVQDEIGQQSLEISAKLVVNCAGPWAPSVAMTERTLVKYSRGTHLLFSTHWDSPSLFLPMPGKSRYYFVWPHFAGTMVGTTEREILELEEDPMPEESEVEEILERLKRDLPESRLDREHLHYAFAGIRTLPLRSQGAEVSRLSRKHIWNEENG
ncbi:MAG: FAD-dependent oxidoreductase, partial [Bdellovibrionales bacterium]|nr:FAD-dependent oxidoreductase [Bdellovibrionales bacterium]